MTASSNITRFRFDVIAHVNTVTNECIFLTHELGAPAKNSVEIVESTLIDHLLRCNNESIKFIVSDNAAVSKSWTTCVALPQYLVEQELTEVAIFIYLGKQPL